MHTFQAKVSHISPQRYHPGARYPCARHLRQRLPAAHDHPVMLIISCVWLIRRVSQTDIFVQYPGGSAQGGFQVCIQRHPLADLQVNGHGMEGFFYPGILVVVPEADYF
jgi:hypothetical protein